MKTIENSTNVTNELTNELLSQIENDNVTISMLYLNDFTFENYGHWKIGITILVETENDENKGLELTTTTTNSLLKDAWEEDEDYFTKESYYENKQGVIDAYFSEVMQDFNIDKLNEVINEIAEY